MPASASPRRTTSGASASLLVSTAWTAVPKMLVFSTCAIRLEQPHRIDRAVRSDFDDRAGGEDGLELVGGAERRETARVDDRDAVAVLGLVQVVRRDEHRRAGRRQAVDQRPEHAAGQRIDAAGRLVEEHDRRLVEDGAAEGEALAPPAGEIGRPRLLAPAEARHLQHELAARFQPRALDAVNAGEEPDVLIDRQVSIEREPLRHVADAALDAFRIAADVDRRRPSRCRWSASAGRTAFGWWSTCRRRSRRGSRRSRRGAPRTRGCRRR